MVFGMLSEAFGRLEEYSGKVGKSHSTATLFYVIHISTRNNKRLPQFTCAATFPKMFEVFHSVTSIMQFAMTVQLNRNKTTRVELPFIRGLARGRPANSTPAATERDGLVSRTSRPRIHALSTPYISRRSHSSANGTETCSATIPAPKRGSSVATGSDLASAERVAPTFSVPKPVAAASSVSISVASASSVSTSVAPDSPHPSLDRYSSLTPVPETPPPERSSLSSPAPEPAVSFLYSTRDLKSRTSATKKTSISWYGMTSYGQIDSPPKLPSNHAGLKTNVLFLHMDQRQRHLLEASGKTGKQLFVDCLLMWIWSGKDVGWEIIEFGEERE
ncbi:hypothetical protein F5890DRAFT_1479374, partial [Lentinula detonsa]